MDILTHFAQDASKFAFKNGLDQKNTIDIYPLDSSNKFNVNSSIVNQIDYETNGFKIDDLKFTGWCIDSTVQNKRKNRDEMDENLDNVNEKVNLTQENFYVNVFNQGEIVTYSSNGKDIVNLIRNKKEIIGMYTIDDEIWTLDTDKCVKIYQYNVVKPKKTFTLIDGKNDEIINFQVFSQIDNSRVISIITEECVYLIDPTKRRPSTIAKFDNVGSTTVDITTDLSKIVIADNDKLSVYQINDTTLTQSWNVSFDKVKLIKNELICALNQNGLITIFNLDQIKPVCEIKAIDSKCIDFVILPNQNNNMIVAWLNVNEPNFKLLTVDDIVDNKEITINNEIANGNLKAIVQEDNFGKEQKQINKDDGDDEDEIENNTNNTKISSKEKNEIVNQLVNLLQTESNETEIIANITLATTWNDSKIIWFINNKLATEDITNYLFQTVINELQSNIWQDTKILNHWFKWLITLKNLPHAFKHNKSEKKQLRHFKTSLKTSKGSMSVLLGIKGKLELLVKQSELREQFSQLDLTQENEVEDEENVVFVDGENDVFVDAHM